jgi:D-alanyl-lipoteichoic acid acyltransferase DltB (MBOAT superfamily)
MTSSWLATERRNLGTIGLILAQLLLALLVVRQFQIESRTFFQVMVLATAGFVIHALLPLSYRFSFFVVLSLVSIVVGLGLFDGSILIVLGLVLIGICHLPVRLRVRVALLSSTGLLFAVWRAGMLTAPFSGAVWPIIASMFMFRVVLYLHAVKHDRKRPTLLQALGYFFMLPNVCFPLYPVVDYSTFVRTYYDREPARIYTTGMRWITRGLLHLILYRFVYQHLGDPAQLVTLGDLVWFLLGTFLLYLRVSGQFHVIAGMLHLFGFRLPETHHLYYLASSFTDFWRRINIYWKDFMMKVVYYPSYFQLRRFGERIALIISTIVVFLVTWILHSYQWFWLRGGFPLEWQDVLFWGILCILVVFGSLGELARPQKRKLGRRPAWSLRLALRRMGTFTVLCVLWSLWSSESLVDWVVMWTVAENVTGRDLWTLAAIVAAGLLIAGRDWSVREADNRTALPFYRQPAFQSAAILAGLFVFGNSALYAPYSPQLASIAAGLRQSTLNAHDAALQHKGYYEKLDNVSRMSAQLWDVQAKRPASWVGLSTTDAYLVRSDFIRGDLRPNVRIMFEDQLLTTNQWGMRDRERRLAKPERTYRIALLGPSHVMGSGVADGETFAYFLEQRLNDSAARESGIHYEVLNFGLAGCSLLHQLAILDNRALLFQPDAVFVTDSPGLKEPVLADIVDVVMNRVAIPYPGLYDFIRQADVSSLANDGVTVPFASVRSLLDMAGFETRMPGREAIRRLRPYADEIVAWTLSQIAATSRAHGAVPVFVALDNVNDPPLTELRAAKDARAAGFVVFDLLDIWKGRDKARLSVAGWDTHPNAAGNRLIADRLFDYIQQHRSELRLTAPLPTGKAN